MVTSDIEERINDVFRRATKDLSKELQDIHLLGLSYEKSNHYKAIETDSKKYSALANDFILEVNTNLSSGLRPAER